MSCVPRTYQDNLNLGRLKMAGGGLFGRLKFL